MNPKISIIKGLHPGIIINRELKKRNIPKGRFAISINEYPQTLVAITKGKRRLTPSLALRIEKEMEWEEGFLLVLQAYYDVEQEKNKLSKNYRPDLSKFRPILFWDTDINKINWEKNKVSIIKRVLERGNETELKELLSFYGKKTILSTLDNIQNVLPAKKDNLDQYLLLLLK